MAQKSKYTNNVLQNQVDYTKHISIPSMINTVLSIAGLDAVSKGFGVEYLNTKNYSWALSRFAIEIYKAPAMGDTINTETWISSASRVVSTRNFVVEDINNNILAAAISQWCIIDLTARTAVDFNKLDVDYNKHICNFESPISKVKKLNNITPQSTIQHKVAYSHIDFNRHVNTIKYIEMMLNMLPLELIDKAKKLRVDLHFISECRYGDTLTIALEQVANNSHFEITKDDGTAAVRGCFEWV